MHKYLLAVMASIFILTGCIEDGFTTSPSDGPLFSTDTLKMGDVFTGQGTPTSLFKVYNHHDKGLIVSSIKFRDETTGSYFRLNVDGLPGQEFHDVEIRANDSIFVLVEATVPENGDPAPRTVVAPLDFTVNGVTTSVVISITGQDVTRLEGFTVTTDTHFTAAQPYLISDSLVVAPGVTLTLDAGTVLNFHDKASLTVRGTLRAEGTPEAPIEMTGDRSGNVVGGIPYEIMSGQWGGVFFTSTSCNNVLSHTVIKNSTSGVTVDSVTSTTYPALTLVNCRLRNSTSTALSAYHASVTAVGCEFAEAPEGPVYLYGGDHRFVNCTFANYYLFSAIYGPLLYLDGDEISADIDNCILYGNGSTLSPEDVMGMPITFRNCLFKTSGSDDENFIGCIYDSDPLFYTVREDYYFDYRLKDGSAAIGMGDASLIPESGLTDFYGNLRGLSPDLGAYVFVPEP